MPSGSVIRSSMLFILLLSVLCSGLHHYHVVNELKTWSEAQSYCREKYTDLATISNIEDMKRLMDSAGSYEGVVWIGLYDKPTSWRWSLSDQSLDGEGDVTFKNWGNNQPDYYGEKEFKCVFMWNGLWNDQNCDKPQHFVCYSNNTNIHGTTATPSGRYIYVAKLKTWTDAQRYCRLRYTDLASVRNQAENQEIQSLVPQGYWVWIGLFIDSWRWWSGGSNSSFTYWRNGQPGNLNSTQEYCAVSRINSADLGKWEDRLCLEKHDFICYKSQEKKQKKHIQLFKLKVESDSTVDLNDPAVLEAMLKQLETRLRDKLGNENVKLGWRKGPDGKVFHKEEKKKNGALVKREL